MRYDVPLQPAKFIKRYKRFFVDAELPDGSIAVAHCANTGSMKGLLNEGATCYLMPQESGKLDWKFELVEAPSGALVGVNTARPNKLVEEAILANEVPELMGYENLKREVKYGQNSRIDILLTDPNKPDCYVEVKNTTLQVGEVAQFPDAVTTRGLKHLNELMDMVKEGHRAVMFYWVHRNDCTHFEPAVELDPEYAAGLKQAVEQGVEVLVYAANVQPEGVTIANKLPIKLS